LIQGLLGFGVVGLAMQVFAKILAPRLVLGMNRQTVASEARASSAVRRYIRERLENREKPP